MRQTSGTRAEAVADGSIRHHVELDSLPTRLAEPEAANPEIVEVRQEVVLCDPFLAGESDSNRARCSSVTSSQSEYDVPLVAQIASANSPTKTPMIAARLRPMSSSLPIQSRPS